MDGRPSASALDSLRQPSASVPRTLSVSLRTLRVSSRTLCVSPYYSIQIHISGSHSSRA